ncbi:MAG TPA: Fe-S cluster assembly protein SufD [Acetobacteraceae bacterium]|nr:Fe-S cluster assembly protein SufD [Acetobacteraceae bacterium]
MTAIAQSGVAGFLARYAAMRDRLPGDLHQRDAAADAFRRAGLPGAAAGRRSEAWKYTSLRPVADATLLRPATPVAGTGTLQDRIPLADVPRIVFVDGEFHPEVSVVPTALSFTRFADRAEFDALAQPDSEPLVALNTMLAEDGAVLSVAAGVDAGLLLLVNTAINHSSVHPRHAIQLGQGARLTLLELSVGDDSYLHNPVFEIRVGPGAVLTHVRLQDESPEAFHLSTVYVDVAENATYDSFGLNIGARIARTEAHVRLGGPKAIAHLNGAQLLADTQHADFTTVVRHDAPSCVSRQTVKNVLAGRSQGVFQGRIEVARAAQKTDGYQMNQALLLSPDAEIDTKPELEIFADDVKCSHGATVGELDADQLFYLRSRGIPDSEARAILVRAFLTEALEAVSDETVRGVLEAAVARWWERQAA